MPDVRDSVEVEISVSVYCNECGNGLCGNTTIEKGTMLYVDLCPKCVNEYDRRIQELEEEIADLKERDNVV